MWIKICANTNLDDALLAAELGADAVGFIFAPSPRRVTPKQAAAIVARLPNSLEKIGVFAGGPSDHIIDAAEEANLTAIQLHSTADPELIRRLYAHFAGRLAIMQVVRWRVAIDKENAKQIAHQLAILSAVPEIAHLLIDSEVNTASGGTGTAFDWSQAQTVFAAHSGLVLAGGLNPENIGEALDQLRPWGVDVATGVESVPGKKDPAKLRKFINSARNGSSTSPK